ncbi:uncharacterized protein LOC130653711 [Hydractinia symbiolongicarpus]|uniref:uncharacterized protein LOC130653711 n=1 Tax=Hydractinia symbiolongicarpus TaxID=13093 RepID=UPI00254E24F4|nr:uncharacterized protein LOC130653711 [Hydractinia symbiolongicarpus]
MKLFCFLFNVLFIQVTVGQGPRRVYHSAHTILSCSVCKDVLQALEGSLVGLEKEPNNLNVKETVSKICEKISNEFSTECNHIIRRFGRRITKHVQKRNIATKHICKVIKIC